MKTKNFDANISVNNLERLYNDLTGENLSIPRAQLFEDKIKKMFVRIGREREYRILVLRYNGNTLETIGHEIGLSKGRIRQIIDKAKKRIQHRMIWGWNR